MWTLQNEWRFWNSFGIVKTFRQKLIIINGGNIIKPYKGRENKNDF